MSDEERDSKPWRSGMPPLQTRDPYGNRPEPEVRYKTDVIGTEAGRALLERTTPDRVWLAAIDMEAAVAAIEREAVDAFLADRFRGAADAHRRRSPCCGDEAKRYLAAEARK